MTRNYQALFAALLLAFALVGCTEFPNNDADPNATGDAGATPAPDFDSGVPDVPGSSSDTFPNVYPEPGPTSPPDNIDAFLANWPNTTALTAEGALASPIRFNEVYVTMTSRVVFANNGSIGKQAFYIQREKDGRGVYVYAEGMDEEAPGMIAPGDLVSFTVHAWELYFGTLQAQQVSDLVVHGRGYDLEKIVTDMNNENLVADGYEIDPNTMMEDPTKPVGITKNQYKLGRAFVSIDSGWNLLANAYNADFRTAGPTDGADARKIVGRLVPSRVSEENINVIRPAGTCAEATFILDRYTNERKDELNLIMDTPGRMRVVDSSNCNF